jgi:polysaccharide biosynthesis/export protein
MSDFTSFASKQVPVFQNGPYCHRHVARQVARPAQIVCDHGLLQHTLHAGEYLRVKCSAIALHTAHVKKAVIENIMTGSLGRVAMRALVTALLAGIDLCGQAAHLPVVTWVEPPQDTAPDKQPSPSRPVPSRPVPSNYTLGPNDLITIRVPDVEEVNEKAVRIDLQGYIKLPMAGHVKAGGLTADQLEAELTRRLMRYVREPQVSVIVTEYRSQPVLVLGAVQNPGVHQVQGRKSLFEILSLAGGLKPEAGNSIKITRKKQWGAIPLANAQDDATHRFSVAEVNISSVMDAKNPQENIEILPNDVISVPQAEVVYVIGAVHKSGGFALKERETLSVLQAVSLAEGLESMAAPKAAKILRSTGGSSTRIEIPVDLQKILAGRSGDVPLERDDILFVPNNVAKSVTLRTIETAIQLGTGVVIYRR